MKKGKIKEIGIDKGVKNEFDSLMLRTEQHTNILKSIFSSFVKVELEDENKTSVYYRIKIHYIGFSIFEQLKVKNINIISLVAKDSKIEILLRILK